MKYDAIIIGSGCAGYSTADWLFNFGFKNIVVLSECRLCGTSRNTGSDKQTYYKLCLDGQNVDSAEIMANTMVRGGSANGELAYIEAINSYKCFSRLMNLGVNFPTDEYGGVVGYQTDHDETPRATSIGPYTSKKMTECLENKVLKVNKTKFLDNLVVVEVVVDNGECKGVIAFDRKRKKHIFIEANYVIACTGAPSSIYKHSVYPHSQTGMSGVLMQAGCKLCNFTEWQYGLASVKFRWNVSGSYMQVIPRFLSEDNDGNITEFLRQSLSDKEIIELTFLKGYEWPFDVNKREKSSKIDILVLKEINKGNKVYLDYINNPSGFDINKLPQIVYEYLKKCNSLNIAPIQRLLNMNNKAYELYLNNNIDLKKEFLQIAVCAQHNNGGVLVDNNWQTSVKRLFAVGEVAGTFGITRPGGSALNSTQVGGLQVARYLSQNYCNSECNVDINAKLTFYDNLLINFEKRKSNYNEIPILMSKYAGIVRELDEIKCIIEKIDKILNTGIMANSYYDFIKAKDMLISSKALCLNILKSMTYCGSRGGSMCYNKGVFIEENTYYRKYLNVFDGKHVEWITAPSVPKYKAWFEQEYNKNKRVDYYEGNNLNKQQS